MVLGGDNYTVKDLTVTPAVDYVGTLIVPLAVSDGELNSDTLSMTITVNAVNNAPTLTAVSNKSIDENTTLA